LIVFLLHLKIIYEIISHPIKIFLDFKHTEQAAANRIHYHYTLEVLEENLLVLDTIASN